MDWKRWLRMLLFPHGLVMALLIPGAGALLVYTMTNLEETAVLRIASYVLAFYALVVFCCRIPAMIRWVRIFQGENRWLRRWRGDLRLRTNVTLTGNVLWNGAYALLQLGLGVYHRSPWFYSLAAYYACLAFMRFFLVRQTLRHRPGAQMRQELRWYRICGWTFLVMNLALSAMMLYRIRENRGVRHHEITTIAMAAYTFASLTMAIVNAVKFRRHPSPAVSAAKAISLASAVVSLLTLENTMLLTFGGEEMTPKTQLLFLAISGGAVAALIVAMAVYMIVQSNERIKCLEK